MRCIGAVSHLVRQMARIGRRLTCLCIFIVVAGCVVAACSGMTTGPRLDGGITDGREPSEGGLETGVTCQPPADANEPGDPLFVSFDGGVPLDQVAFSLAVARCNYWSRCSPLAPYVTSQCVDALSHTGSWQFTTCTQPGAGNRQCFTNTIAFPFPSAAVFQAVRTGLVIYDPEQESACLQLLQAEDCHGTFLWEFAPPCMAAFSCAPDAVFTDAGSRDAGPVDGGMACPPLSPTTRLLPCSTAGDCTNAPFPGGPYCVDEYCTAGPCGDQDAVGCPYVGIGQSCDSDAPFLGISSFATPWGSWPAKVCSPGLTCSGLTNNGGLGVCSTAQDVGGPCTPGAATTGCDIGLICQCGICQIPPSRGPCVDGSCQAGVAFCDLKSNMCVPVRQIGGDCTDAQQCAPKLGCDSTGTCEPYTP